MGAAKSDHDTLWELVKGIKFGMLTHRQANGMLHAHPLTTQNESLDAESHLYFFISRSSELAQCLQQDGNVNVSYANPSQDCYVSVSGQATIIEDQDKKKDLWSPLARTWFPAGVSDPDLALLEVRIHHAEYWDAKESKMVQLAKMARAAILGELPRKTGEHKELHIS